MAVAMIGPKFYAWDRNGKPLAFGKLYTYQARTNTPKKTYQSEDQQVENTNPVILNGEGYANVYLDGSYKMVLKDDKDNEIWSSDPVTSQQAQEWINCYSASYVNPTTLKIGGNVTDQYEKHRRVRVDNNTVSYAYSTISSSVFASGETTVTITEPVITTGVVGICTSVIGVNSSFNQSDLGEYTSYMAETASDLALGKTPGSDIALQAGQRWVTKVHNETSNEGGADYLIVDISDYSGTPDGIFDFFVGGGGLLVAVLQVNDSLDLAKGGFYPTRKPDWSDFFESAFNKNKNIYSKFINGTFLISRPLDIPLDGKVNLNLCKLGKAAGYTPNSNNTIINFSGSNGLARLIDGTDIVSSGDKLISFTSGVSNCIEDGCLAPIDRFLLNQGVSNNNISKTLDRLVPQYGETRSPISKKFKMNVTSSVIGGNGDFRRVRYIPSLCRITHIKVTNTSNSPDFAFEVYAKQGTLTALYSRARDSSNINVSVDIDFVHEDFDDVLQLRVTSYGAISDVFEVEISYETDRRCNVQASWFYSSQNDFLKPHKSNAPNHAEGIRAIEYRSYIDGGGLSVTNAVPDRKEDANYNWPHVKVPNPGGTRDTSKTTELKFYLNYSAAQALRDGATHLRIRLQETPAIKCTVLNGWLSQAYDGAPVPHLETLGFQPDIEIDLPPAGVDDFDAEVILIPLDIKAMQQGALQMQQYDFNFFYLTFYQNLPGHLPIEWDDDWSFIIDFIREPGLT